MTLGWSIEAAARDSRTKRSRKSGSSASCGAMSFSATGRSRSSWSGPVDHAHAAAAGDPQDAVAGEHVSLVQGRAPTPLYSKRRPRSDASPGGPPRADILAASMRGPSAIRAAAWGAVVRRRGRAARPPPPSPPAARGHRRRRRGAARAVAWPCARSQARDVAVVRACRCTPTSRPTRCPTTIPSACARGCACDYPGARRPRDRPRRAARPAAAARASRARGRAAARAEQVLVWCHWLWFFVPHGTVAYLLAAPPRPASRAARRRSTRSSTSGSSATGRCPTAPPWYAAEQGVLGADASRAAADDARARRGVLEGRLGPSLRCPGRQPSRRHALPALRDIRDGRPRPQRRRAGRRARWAGPTRSRWASRSSTWASTTSSTSLAGLALAEGVRRQRHRAAPALRAREPRRSSGSRRGRTHERRRPSTSATSTQPQDADDEEMPRVGHHARAGVLGFGLFVVVVDRLPVLRPAADLGGTSTRRGQRIERRRPVVAGRSPLAVRVPVLRRLRDPLPDVFVARRRRAIGWRESYQITMAGAGRHAPVRGRRRRRHRAHGVGAAALRDGARARWPTGWSPSSSCLRRLHGRDARLRRSACTSGSSRARRRSPSPSCRRSSRCMLHRHLPGHVAAARRRRAPARRAGRAAPGARARIMARLVDDPGLGRRRRAHRDRPRARPRARASSAPSPAGASTSRCCGRASTPSASRRRSR